MRSIFVTMPVTFSPSMTMASRASFSTLCTSSIFVSRVTVA